MPKAWRIKPLNDETKRENQMTDRQTDRQTKREETNEKEKEKEMDVKEKKMIYRLQSDRD